MSSFLAFSLLLLLEGRAGAYSLSQGSPQAEPQADVKSRLRYVYGYSDVFSDVSGRSRLCSLAENPFGFVAQAPDLQVTASRDGRYVAIPGLVERTKNPNPGGTRADPSSFRFWTDAEYDYAVGVVDVGAGCRIVRLVNLDGTEGESPGTLVESWFTDDGRTLFIDEYSQVKVFSGNDFGIHVGTFPFSVRGVWSLPGEYVAASTFSRQGAESRMGWALFGTSRKLLGTVATVLPPSIAKEGGAAAQRILDGDVWIGGGEPVLADSAGIVFSFLTERRAHGKVTAHLRRIARVTLQGQWTNAVVVPADATSFRLEGFGSGEAKVLFDSREGKGQIVLKAEEPKRP